MRVPLSWLREFVPVDLDADVLAEKLTLAGLAVEEVVRTGADIQGVVVGEVKAKDRHPDSDRLMLVTATDGTAERHIVCGADNYAVGDRVPMALPGARLPGGMTIEQRPVLGIVSDGMLCSAKELAIADDHSGILLLDRDLALGSDVVAALSLDDLVFDIDVTGNRPDALSILGIAREVSALTGVPLTIPAAQPFDVVGDVGPSITVKDAKGCPRYVGRVIDGIRVGPSPWSIRRRLLAAGMRPVSNVVDVTNYVMLERGQPLHAFDLSTLAGEQIVVRRPTAKERTITTLDGQERALARDDLLICDADRPIALAGVMGGAETEVSEKTTRILLESATFVAARIARVCRRTAMRTEASMRYEHGVDPGVALPSSDVATGLLVATAGGAAGPATDVSARVAATKSIALRIPRMAALLGAPVDATEATTFLQAIGCTVGGNAKTLRVTPPSWRPDITIEANLLEEVARLYGYDRIPETLPSIAVSGGLTNEQKRRRTLARTLEARGVSEAVTLSLLPPSLADRFGLPEGHPWRSSPRLSNPLSEEESVLRPSLIPGLLLATQRNIARRVTPVALYEVGRVFALDGEQVHESLNVAWVLTGSAATGLHEAERPLDFFDAKGTLDAVAMALGLVGLSVVPSKPAAPYHPARIGSVVFDGNEVGVIAEVHPRVTGDLDIPGRVAIVELALDQLLAAPAGRAPGPQPRFPSVRRDLAVVLGSEETAADADRVIRGAAGEMLDALTIFDDYTGDRIGEGRRSLAFALELRAPDRTLTDEDVAPVMAAVEQAVRASGWQVRGSV